MASKSQKKIEQLSQSQKVLSDIRAYYTDDKNGLLSMAGKLKTMAREGIEDPSLFIEDRIIAPRQNITILLLGNHSAGKSSFINWYIDQTIQKESTAIETTAFTWVVSGKTRDTFIGGTTMKYLGYIDGIDAFPGVLDNLYTEVVPSKANKFEYVDLVDTPGLADDLTYPYDIKNVLSWIADRVDLVFVFFDPHGQALCKKTKQVVSAIAARNHGKLNYILSKVDTVPTFSQLFRLGIQLAQSLTSLHQGRFSVENTESGLLSHKNSVYLKSKKYTQLEEKVIAKEDTGSFGEHAFKMYGICLPSKSEQDGKVEGTGYNDMQGIHDLLLACIFKDLLEIIDQKKVQMPQNVQIQFRVDCENLLDCTSRLLAEHSKAKSLNQQIWFARTCFLAIIWGLPIMLMLHLFHSLMTLAPAEIRVTLAPLLVLFRMVPVRENYLLLGGMIGTFFVLLVLSKVFLMFFKPLRSHADIVLLSQYKKHLVTLLEEKTGVVESMLDSLMSASNTSKS